MTSVPGDLSMNASVASPASEMSNIYNNSVVRFWQNVFHDMADPRTRDWFLMSSPVPGASIMFGYLYFVLSWGPRHMEHRKPYKLKNTLLIYNLVQVVLSIWLFWEGLDAAWLKKYSWKCEPVDYSNNPEALRVARAVYMYFLAKISELLDTVFFVLRKKERQITFLHMYHHTVMPLISWGATKYYPGGHGTFIGVINSFVHIVMYTYYLLAAALPQYQKYFWWKKYITTLQMGQFCLAFLHSLQLLVYDCEYPRWSLVLILPNVMFFYFLFSDFYNKAYVSEEDKLAAKQLAKELKENGSPKQNGELNGNTEGLKKLANGKVNGDAEGLKKLANGKANGEVDGLKKLMNGKVNGEAEGLKKLANGKANGDAEDLKKLTNGKPYGDAEGSKKLTNGKIQNGKVKRA